MIINWINIVQPLYQFKNINMKEKLYLFKIRFMDVKKRYGGSLWFHPIKHSTGFAM